MLNRVRAIYAGRAGPTKDARDDVYSFFQSSYHLKDWLFQDEASGVSKGDVENLINGSTELGICGDLCNASKHSTLTSTRTGDPTTSMPRNDVTVGAPPVRLTTSVGGGSPPPPPPESGTVSHRFYVQSGGNEYDALALAEESVRQWDAFLRGRKLL